MNTKIQPRQASVREISVLLFAAALVSFVALTLPDYTGPATMMTHYMGLLSYNQPWNLFSFMAIPVILAEILAISELALLLRPDLGSWVRTLNQWAGRIAGLWFLGITVYLLKNAVIPLTVNNAWNGGVDLIAVGFYLLGVVPLMGITLLEFGVIGTTADSYQRLHTTFVAIFLVVAHIAMIFGMLDPAVFNNAPAMDHSGMSGM